MAIVLAAAFIGASNVFAQKRSEKRGVGEDNLSNDAEVTALAPGVSWYYNWGSSPSGGITDDVLGTDEGQITFYPMAWDENFNETRIREYLTAHPDVKYLLGFNEPNFKAQANLTPAEVAELWPRLEAIADDFGLELVGPAVNYSPDAPYTDPKVWYDEFFRLYPEARIDYIALHCYMIQPEAVMGFIDEFYERYGRKIWLTEFCAWDGLTRDETNGYATQRKTMTQKIEALELSDHVAKYAWFKVKMYGYPFCRFMYYSTEDAAAGQDGVLTELGQIYVHMSSFDLNHYYGTDDIIPATNYVQSTYSSLELSTDAASTCPLQWESFGMGCTATYLVDVPEAGTYPLCLRLASEAYRYAPTFEIYSDGNLLTTVEIPETGSTDKWETRVVNIDLPAGQQRLMLKSAKNTTCKFGWFTLNEEAAAEASPISDVMVETSFSLRMDGDKLSVDSSAKVRSLLLTDTCGKTVRRASGNGSVTVSSLLPGIYLVNILFEDGTTKTVKQIIRQ